jgi:hypothetical protein
MDHLGVDVDDSPSQQLLGRLARTHAGVADSEEIGDLAQSQTQTLRTLDEPQTIDCGIVVAAVPGRRTRGSWQEASALVVPHRVGRDTDLAGKVRHPQTAPGSR